MSEKKLLIIKIVRSNLQITKLVTEVEIAWRGKSVDYKSCHKRFADYKAWQRKFLDYKACHRRSAGHKAWQGKFVDYKASQGKFVDFKATEDF